MGLIAEFRSRARTVVGPVLGICVIGYFVYHAVHGERGLYAWLTMKQQVAAARAQSADIAARRRALEARVRLLHPQSLDPDMLDEAARRMLDYGRPDDIVILTGPRNRR